MDTESKARVSSTLTEDENQLLRRYSRPVLLRYATEHGIKYSHIDNRHPSRREILEDLGRENKDTSKELSRIVDLRKGLRQWTLKEKAIELGVDEEGLSPLALATRIYCKDRQALEELHDYQSAAPRTSTTAFVTTEDISSATLDKAIKHLPRLITEKLSDKRKGTIAQLDRVASIGDDVRFVVSVEQRKRINERPKSPKYPGRKGPHIDYILRYIRASYNRSSRMLRMSAPSALSESFVSCFSTAALKRTDAFSKVQPDRTKIHTIFTSETTRKELAKRGIRVTELELREVPLEGYPSRLLLQGDDLVKTVTHLEENGIRLVGPNLSEVAKISQSFDNKRIAFEFPSGRYSEVGQINAQDRENINVLLRRLGLSTLT
jgi:hypothetical protein